MKSYKKHLESTLSFGEHVSLTRKPIFRSSAIFPVLHDKHYTSRVLYMGYWLLKRHIPEIQLLVTLRDEQGNIILRKSNLINNVKSFSIYLFPLLQEAKQTIVDQRFIGSLELEIFSTRDLVFPYPAFVVNYMSKHGCGTVHTTGRIYNDIEDNTENEAYQIPESGFDIYSDPEFDPFFCFVNGHFTYNNPTINYTIINKYNEILEGIFTLDSLNPYQSCFVNIRKHIDISTFLKGEKGTIKLSHNLKGFFSRFIAGNFHNTHHGVSITHTYYDCSKVNDESAYFQNTDKRFNDSSVFIPLFIQNNQYTDFVIYPIFSPSKFDISIDLYDIAGNKIHTLPNWKNHTNTEQSFFTISFKSLIQDISKSELINRVVGADIIIYSLDRKRIPTRLKFGLNIGLKGHEIDLPTNICFAAEVVNPKLLDKPGTFKWAPILNCDQSLIVITNGSNLKQYDREGHCLIEFYREIDTKKITRNITLPPFGQIHIDIKKDTEELQDFFGEQTGWITIKTNNPFISCWYFDFNTSGLVGGDHSF